MKNLTAIYKFSRNGNVKHMTREYRTKGEFKQDLKDNGMRILAILTDKEIQEIKEAHWSDSTELYQEYVREVLR